MRAISQVKAMRDVIDEETISVKANFALLQGGESGEEIDNDSSVSLCNDVALKAST